MITLIFLIFLSIFSLSFGMLLLIKPDIAIDIQKQFYEKINWKIEPLSVRKEMRNTRIMGVFLVGLALLIIYFIHKF